jgi:hypothetical protein
MGRRGNEKRSKGKRTVLDLEGEGLVMAMTAM